MSKSHVLLGSVGVVLAALLVGCATDGVEKRSGDCGAADYQCISAMAHKYRQQALELEAMAQRYEVEADFQAAQDGHESEQAKRSRDLAKRMWSRAQEAEQRARELGSHLPHGMVSMYNAPGIAGYDAVAYFTDGKAMRGSGYHVTLHDGVTYAFTSKEHKKMFEANPQKYLPAYGGYCAYGVAAGMKVVVDPEAWKIVDGVLYLIQDKDIQKKWENDIPSYIKKAEANWPKIQGTAPRGL